MANTFLNTPQVVSASSNPQANIEQVTPNNTSNIQQPQTQQTINPITIPIQIQPQVAPQNTQISKAVQPQVLSNDLQAQQPTTAPTPQVYKDTVPNNVVDFNQIYSSYQNQNNVSGTKKSSIGTTIVTPTVNTNSVKGQYQSAYADTINSLISEMLTQMNNGFQYDPTSDNALKVATEYASNTTLQSLAGSGVLNSSATAERVARIVSELIPTYEEKAHDRWIENLGQLANTAQIVMGYDSQQFEYWKDAKDREFENAQFEFQKKQQELENAWKRVDELGYVDNKASVILGVKVGTLSGQARLQKEQQEFELQRMKEQAEIEYQNNVALYKLRNELDTQQSKALAEYEYTLANKYGGKSSTSNTSLSTYESIIQNRWTEKGGLENEKLILTDNISAWDFIKTENMAGRMSDNDAYALMAKYNISNPYNYSVQKKGNVLYITKSDGNIATLNITPDATREKIIEAGKLAGVDLSEYV